MVHCGGRRLASRIQLWRPLACVACPWQVSGSKRLISRMAAPEPSPACMVCGTATAQLALDTGSWTLQQLVDKASHCRDVHEGAVGLAGWLQSAAALDELLWCSCPVPVPAAR